MDHPTEDAPPGKNTDRIAVGPRSRTGDLAGEEVSSTAIDLLFVTHADDLSLDDSIFAVRRSVEQLDRDVPRSQLAQLDLDLYREVAADWNLDVARGPHVGDLELMPHFGHELTPAHELASLPSTVRCQEMPLHGRGKVVTLQILTNHSVGVENRANRANGRPHHGDPITGQIIGAAAIEEWDHLLFEQPEERPALYFVLIFVILVLFPVTDSPTVLAVETFCPPAIDDAQVDSAVDGSLHPAGSARLERSAWGVQPDVAALHEVAGHLHVVVLEEHDPTTDVVSAGQLDELPDQLLALLVSGVGLPGKNDLNRPPLTVENT